MLDLTPALPEIFLALAAMALLVVGVYRPEGEGTRLLTPLAAAALLITLVMVMLDDGARVVTLGGQFIVDRFASFFKAFILLGSGLTLLMAPRHMRAEQAERFEFPVLALFSTLGAMMMISANSLMALYMGLELLSLPLYVMCAFRRDDAFSAESGLKYFILGALSSGLLLYGCSLVYGFTGTLAFDGLARAVAGAAALPAGAVVGLVFIAAGLAFKMSAVPFHMWTPDVYEGAPTPVTAFLAAAPKLAAVGLTLRLLITPFGEAVGQWQQIVVFISLASMLLGSFAAIGQTNIKRLMAYSAIGHIGYALVGLAAGTQQGINAVLVYMAIYLVMTVGTFGVILACRKNGRPIERVDDFAGLAKAHPMLGFATAVFMFSLAGVPPLAGFIGKWYVFLAAVQAGLVPLAVVGVLTSVVAAFYYIRVVKVAYFDDADGLEAPPAREIGVITGGAAVFTLFLCLYPGPLLTQARAAAAALFPS